MLYGTEKITRGTIDARIPAPGIYYLGISNSFSTFADKAVTAEIKLQYEVLK